MNMETIPLIEKLRIYRPHPQVLSLGGWLLPPQKHGLPAGIGAPGIPQLQLELELKDGK